MLFAWEAVHCFHVLLGALQRDGDSQAPHVTSVTPIPRVFNRSRASCSPRAAVPGAPLGTGTPGCSGWPEEPGPDREAAQGVAARCGGGGTAGVTPHPGALPHHGPRRGEQQRPGTQPPRAGQTNDHPSVPAAN